MPSLKIIISFRFLQEISKISVTALVEFESGKHKKGLNIKNYPSVQTPCDSRHYHNEMYVIRV